VGAPSGGSAEEGRALSDAPVARIKSTLAQLKQLGGTLEALIQDAGPEDSGKSGLHAAALEIKRRRLALQRLALGAKALTHNNKLADSEPSWAKVDKTKLPRRAFADMGEAGSVSSWRYPHHWVSGGGSPDDNGRYTAGTMYLHKGGLHAGWAAAQGARAGVQAPAAVKSHLNAHRRAIGLEE
jgi:hypothetical protein